MNSARHSSQSPETRTCSHDLSRAGVASANYNYAVKAGSILWIAGQLALDEDGNVVSSDPGEQAAQCMENWPDPEN
jgi:enamine deaminase RidA (YjgF/YER057c/UK114 family)